jgi:hypothetical protein
MTSKPFPTYRRAAINCLLTLLTGLICAGLLTAAALVPAPPVLLPFIVGVCVAVPMLAAWEASVSVAVLRNRGRSGAPGGSPGRLDGGAVRRLRRQLDQLPEIRHPLGL